MLFHVFLLLQVSSTGSNTNTGGAVGAQGMPSKLWEKNRMLASLLAKQPSAPTTPLPLPNPHLSRPFPRLPTATTPQRHPQSYHTNNALAHLLK